MYKRQLGYNATCRSHAELQTKTLAHFNLDPYHYLSGPALSFDAMLKETGARLEMLHDPEMYLFLSDNLRGGVTGTSTRYCCANNEYNGEGHNSHATHQHIMSWDANSLYGHAMTQPLPTGNFRWMTAEELQNFDAQADLSNGCGYIVEVDLHYPRQLHDLHNQFPLAPERLDVPSENFSQYVRRVAQCQGLRQQSSGSKLMTTLYDKQHYVIHHEHLRMCLAMGLQLTAVHGGLTFTEAPFMKSYIMLNTEARKSATSSFDVALYKSYNNYIFGHSCMNVFKQRDIRLVSSPKQFHKLAMKNEFKGCTVVSANLALVELARSMVTLNKAIYVGFSVLELSKVHMYRFYYEYLVPMYQKRGLYLLFTDTDSFFVAISNQPGLYKHMQQNSQWFDLSGYPETHFLHDASRKRDLGLFKDVHANGRITEFIALRSKMYAVKVVPWGEEEEEEEDLKAKGIHRSALRDMTFESYRHALEHVEDVNKYNFNAIRSVRHHVQTTASEKVGLSAYDDKRLYLNCGIHSMAYGHYRLSEQCMECTPNTG